MIGKADLLEAIAGTNRGLLASPAQKQAILSGIARLEDGNPNPRPLTVPTLLDGNWRLLYTTSQELLGINSVPLVTLGQIYQCIRVQTGRIYNIAEVPSLPLLDGVVSVAAQFTPVSDRRVNVKFDRAVFGLQRLVNYESPDQWIEVLDSPQRLLAVDLRLENRDRQGWLDITYLDRDLRIGRGNEGSVFVLMKV